MPETDTRIMLASGALFDILDPEGSDFTLQDIAHGLGRVCRFAGQSSRFYSVAEHCVHVSRLVPLAHARAALLHDASEAFIGDVTRPLKALLPEYREIEARIEDAIATRLLSAEEHAVAGGAFPADPLKFPAIKRADLAMCLVEARQLMPHQPGYWSSLPVDPDAFDQARLVRVDCKPPEAASQGWLRAWHHYSHLLEQYPLLGCAK
jgi:hypothetical protein